MDWSLVDTCRDDRVAGHPAPGGRWEHNDGMPLGEYRTQLRAATARADAPVLVQLLTATPWPTDALQLIGDAILVAMAGSRGDAAVLARRCIESLRVRD